MSVRLKNPWHECPIDGFWVNLGAVNKKKQFWSFGEAVTWFRDIAISNPQLKLPTDPAAVANFIDQQNALRCLTYRGGETYVIQEGGPAHFLETKKATLLKPLVVVGDKFRQLAAGATLLDEWQHQGSPVIPRAEANTRAAVCVGCPKNGLGDLTRWFTVFASETIRKRIESAQQLRLQTDSDDRLGICEACLCPLKLKVHVPLPNIQKHLTPKSRESLDPRCWILQPPQPSTLNPQPA